MSAASIWWVSPCATHPGLLRSAGFLALARLAGFRHRNRDRLLAAPDLPARAAFQRALLVFVHDLFDFGPLRCLGRHRHELRCGRDHIKGMEGVIAGPQKYHSSRQLVSEAAWREGMVATDEQNFVEYSCAERIATITLNRPDKLNAVSDEVVVQLSEALRRFDLDPEAEVAIINGNGRAFCSGADVRQRQLRSRDEFKKLGGPQGWGTNSADLFTRAVNWKPLIAAVHGYVLGLGLGLTLECDLIVAEAGTRFQLTET